MQIHVALLRHTHRFLSQNLVYPLVLSTMLAGGTWLAREVYFGSKTFGFIPFNLALAWLPYLFSLIVAYLYGRYPGRWWLLLLPGGLWLIFFPNALYTFTDLLHFDEQTASPVWYDIGMFGAFAWTGLLLAVVSLNIMQFTVKNFLGSLLSWLFVAGASLLSGLGIYLGRFMNWNSWDLFLKPQEVWADIAVALLYPFGHLKIYGITILFGSILLVCYITFISAQQRERR
jgi:uncharacterized membrane protein